jgi:hypothetical protein
MTDPERTRIIDKVKKLLALADGAGATPGESAAAAARAAEILERYKLERAEVDATDDETVSTDNELTHVSGSIPTWQRMLAFTVGKATGTQSYLLKEGPRTHGYPRRFQRLMLIGRPSDVEVAKYLFMYCKMEIERLTKKYADLGDIIGQKERNNFRVGAVMTLAEKLGVIRDEARAAASSTAIVRVEARDEAVQAVVKSLDMRTARKPSIAYDQDARALGKDAAREIEIRKGVGDGEKAKGLKE